MTQEELNRSMRDEKRSRSLGEQTVCQGCGYDQQEALTRDDRGVFCYECRQWASGRLPLEAHHHFGRKVDAATVEVPGNVHRALSEAQRDHPPLAGRPGGPFLWLTAGLLGLVDHLEWWVTRLRAIADFFLELPDWIDTLDLTEEQRESFPPLFGMGLR